MAGKKSAPAPIILPAPAPPPPPPPPLPPLPPSSPAALPEPPAAAPQPAPPRAEDAPIEEARRKELERLARTARGRAATLLASAEEQARAAPVVRKTLLGQ